MLPIHASLNCFKAPKYLNNNFVSSVLNVSKFDAKIIFEISALFFLDETIIIRKLYFP